MEQVRICLGRFQPFTLGHLKMATYKCKGPETIQGFKGSINQKELLREQPNIEEINKQKTLILVVKVEDDQVDKRHPFPYTLMKEEMDLVKKYQEIEDVMFVDSADICAWGEMIKSKGYQASVWITGDDEAKPYVEMAMKVPEYEEHNRDNRDCKDAYTKSFYVESIKRDNSSDDFLETISGTKVRESINNDDKELFSKMMPKGCDKLFDKFKEALSNPNLPEKYTKPKKPKKIKEYLDIHMKTLYEVLVKNNIQNRKYSTPEEFWQAARDAYDGKRLADFWGSRSNVDMLVTTIENGNYPPVHSYPMGFDNDIKDFVTTDDIKRMYKAIWKDAVKEMYSTSNFGYNVFCSLRNAPCLEPGDLDEFICQNTIASKGISTDAIEKDIDKRNNSLGWQYLSEISRSPNLTSDILIKLINNAVTPSKYQLSANGNDVSKSYWQGKGILSFSILLTIKNLPIDDESIDKLNCKLISKYILDKTNLEYDNNCKYKMDIVKDNLKTFFNNPNLSKLYINKIKTKYKV